MKYAALTLLLCSCVTRRELGPPATSHEIECGAVLRMCAEDPECSAVKHADIPHTEFLDELCKQAEHISGAIRGRRVPER